LLHEQQQNKTSRQYCREDILKIYKLKIMSNKTLFYKEGRLLLRKINPDKILFLRSEGNDIHFFERLQSHVIRITFEAALKQLPENKFVQIHRSYAVSVDHIETISKEGVSLIPMPRMLLPVSRQYYPLLMERIEIVGSVQ
jgi:DNA-binding LytR/AlgR family response regulator